MHRDPPDRGELQETTEESAWLDFHLRFSFFWGRQGRKKARDKDCKLKIALGLTEL